MKKFLWFMVIINLLLTMTVFTQQRRRLEFTDFTAEHTWLKACIITDNNTNTEYLCVWNYGIGLALCQIPKRIPAVPPFKKRK